MAIVLYNLEWWGSQGDGGFLVSWLFHQDQTKLNMKIMTTRILKFTCEVLGILTVRSSQRYYAHSKSFYLDARVSIWLAAHSVEVSNVYIFHESWSAFFKTIFRPRITWTQLRCRLTSGKVTTTTSRPPPTCGGRRQARMRWPLGAQDVLLEHWLFTDNTLPWI